MAEAAQGAVMSRVKTRSLKQRRPSKELTLSEALERIDDPSLATHLSVFYDELARAQREGDREGAQYARRAIAEAEMLYIDPDTCIDCGLCVDECPVTAIFPQEDLPAEWAEFIEKNAAYYKK